MKVSAGEGVSSGGDLELFASTVDRFLSLVTCLYFEKAICLSRQRNSHVFVTLSDQACSPELRHGSHLCVMFWTFFSKLSLFLKILASYCLFLYKMIFF